MTDNEKIEISIAQILKNEGGYVNNPADKGGETNFGISKRAYPQLDIKNLSKETAIEIYKKDYAEPMRQYFAGMPLNVVYQIIDSAVNCGVARTKQLLAKINVAKDFKQVRTEYYNSIAVGSNAQFLKGWLKRVNVIL